MDPLHAKSLGIDTLSPNTPQVQYTHMPAQTTCEYCGETVEKPCLNAWQMIWECPNTHLETKEEYEKRTGHPWGLSDD